ncbi:MAG TPA: hypothetical protein PKK05_23390, partial [Leptospiraceae bacterium]|nr:hypothetical protein [Leptospiraceae bacterium]
MNRSYRTQEQFCPESSFNIPQNDRYLLIFQRWAAAPSVLSINKVFYILRKSIVLLLLILGAACIRLEPSIFDTSKNPAALFASLLLGSAAGGAVGWSSSFITGSGPLGIQADAAANRLYVVNNGSNTFTVFNAATGAVVSTLPTGQFPSLVAVNSTANLAYVTNRQSNSVT